MFIVCTIMLVLGLLRELRSVVVSIVVERSKKCWDFCTTILLIHLVISTLSHVEDFYAFIS